MSEKKSTKQEADINQEVTKPEENVSGQPAEAKGPAAVIYLGPPISGVGMPGTVYRNGLPPQLQKMKEEIPALTRLLVPVKSAARVCRELQDKQTAVSICYQTIVAYVKKGGEG